MGWLTLAGFLAVATPLCADTIFLKGGQRLEGLIEDKGSAYEIKTERAVLTVPKEDVVKVVKSVEAFVAQAEAFHAKARSLYDEGVKIENDPKIANARLREGVDLLRQAVDVYHEARDTYVDDKYLSLDHAAVKLLQEMRIYRDKFVSEVAASLPSPEEKTQPKKEESAPSPVTPPQPAQPSAKDPGTAHEKPDLATLLARIKGGDLEAMYALGMHYDLTEWSGTEAMKWLKTAAEKNHLRAQVRLGALYLAGRGARQDNKEAKKWFQRAEAKGSALAQYYLGVMHFEGLGTPRSLKRSNEWCDRAYKQIRAQTEQGDAEALCAFGWMAQEGMGIQKSPDKALQSYLAAAEQGYVPAHHHLGVMYRQGKGVSKSRTESSAWFRKAAEQGYAEAQVSLGEVYDNIDNEFEGGRDFASALEWYRKAVAQGHPRSLFRVGQFHLWGNKGIPLNEAEGTRLWQDALRTATGQTQLLLLNDLGYSYRFGQGLKKDPKEGMRYFKLAADMGHAMSQYNVGALLFYDMNNHTEAIKWYLLAARQGYDRASNSMGDCYVQGKGVGRNLDEAERWYLAAIQQGWKQAEASLQRVRDERAKKRP